MNKSKIIIVVLGIVVVAGGIILNNNKKVDLNSVDQTSSKVSSSVSTQDNIEKIKNQAEVYYQDPCTKLNENKIIKSADFVGNLEGFVWGDYLHATVKDKNEKSQTFFTGEEDSCFMAFHKPEQLTISYEVSCNYIQEGAGFYPIETINQIRAGKDDFKSWSKSNNYWFNEDLKDKCENEIQKYIQEN